MTGGGRWSPVSSARIYLGAQALAGAVWWASVAVSDDVRRWTLGEWSPAALVVPDLVLFVGASGLAALSGNRIVAAVAAVWTIAITLALTVYGLVARAAGWGVVAMAVASIGVTGAAATIWLGRLPIEWFFVGPFNFQVAEEASGRVHLRRSLVQLVCFWVAFFVIVPWVLVVGERRLGIGWAFLDGRGWRVVGVTAFVAASAFGLWACVSIALRGDGTPLPARTARRLVVSGPYRHVRNPMAVAGALQTVAVGLWAGSWTVVAVAVVGALAWDAFIRPAEEADLLARFGSAYERYCSVVRCWVPTMRWRDPVG